MKTKTILLGRGANVDVDLSADNVSLVCSRRQAIIGLEFDGTFWIKNIGKCDMFVNKVCLVSGRSLRLPNYCILEVGGCKLAFFRKIK